ncbi:unnamed protein product [Fusarium graminearum]|uniref:Chromosome 1, complete genome n=1 Tax=Gibberella zeae (strain ATCC MYA-4620 / CBS 123657 / FGSC 9075 / NRRL 31084 / PH-1) TaxID=229533 RepID=A0A098D781_GIBZE|nr:unnamed protein product [Fusarium graminearum]CZS77569.1 unnamed protein product [Fusarium graminearum]
MINQINYLLSTYPAIGCFAGNALDRNRHLDVSQQWPNSSRNMNNNTKVLAVRDTKSKPRVVIAQMGSS